jgi:hypothetical protein
MRVHERDPRPQQHAHKRPAQGHPQQDEHVGSEQQGAHLPPLGFVRWFGRPAEPVRHSPQLPLFNRFSSSRASAFSLKSPGAAATAFSTFAASSLRPRSFKATAR